MAAFAGLGLCATNTRPADSNVVSDLNRRLETNEATFSFDPISGYLKSVLAELRVPVESQTVVFSKTSAQANLISADNPRALYFNDDVAVGWVRGSSQIEIAVTDSVDSLAFYILPQKSAGPPRFERETSCLSCHHAAGSNKAPAMLIFSTPEQGTSGNPIVVDHRTPLSERWGGWYVTGFSRRFHHLGNRIGQGWLQSLYDQFYTAGYPTEYSDVVALMTLEHQTGAVNLIVRLATEARQANALTKHIQETADELADYLLFADEAPLPSKIMGTSGFTEQFASQGPFDGQGRSLREFDLNTRLMKYPISYMIYSKIFKALPPFAKAAVYGRIRARLSTPSGRLSSNASPAIESILTEMLSDFRQ